MKDSGGQVIHGHCKKRVSPTYKSWTSMKDRCNNLNADNYPRYGGKGVMVCDCWLNSFVAFLEDMGIRPEGTTLDRIDNDGNYEPGNCRWSTTSVQNSNRRSYRHSDEWKAKMKVNRVARQATA